MERRRYIIQGKVQGVGFRPFVFLLGEKFSCTGKVQNTEKGVCLEIQGTIRLLNDFEKALQEELPPLAKITALEKTIIPLLPLEKDFVIEESQSNIPGHAVLISPDVAHCQACKAEMLDKNNKRYLYPFINCTHCGPRYSITKSIPYDRKSTSMACFPLCAPCEKEYKDPRDRRFHAQPTACTDCGVKIWTNTGEEGNKALEHVIQNLKAGKIVAIKGLGGFHLACDAFNEASIHLLRQRKNRPHKSLALMVQDLESAKKIAHISHEEESLLLSNKRPIVICKRKEILPEILNPDTDTIGIMLPSTPLHELLFYGEAFHSTSCFALVMTSGNIHGEPICLGNREARKKLAQIADLFLFHNRDIVVRVDDSVLRANTSFASQSGYTIYRRARGFVPEPCDIPKALPISTKNVLALGSELKATASVTKGQHAFVGQHTGDMAHTSTNNFLEETAKHLIDILQVKPSYIVVDAHPNASALPLAEDFAQTYNGTLLKVQHHVAHAFALLADNNWHEPALIGVLDGNGYGLDNTIWGGELFYIDPTKALYQRIGSFKPVLQPGGDKATENPWYMTEAYGHLKDFPRVYKKEVGKDLTFIQEIISKDFGIKTSSCGRLFDAVGALLGCPPITTYEGQTAMALEALQEKTVYKPTFYEVPIYVRDNFYSFDSSALFHVLVNKLQKGEKPGHIARFFHNALAEGLINWALAATKEKNVRAIGFCGGVLLNQSLGLLLPDFIKRNGYIPLIHQHYSPSDASISLGQGYYALCKIYHEIKSS